MNKWIAEFELEDGDIMPEHMDLNYMGAKIDFYCRPMWIPVSERLPEMAFGCFVTVEEDDRNGEPQSVLYPEFVGYNGGTWNNADGEPIPFEVIAWMPLPPCYESQ